MLRGARGGVQYIYNLTNFDNRSEPDLAQNESDLTHFEPDLAQNESDLSLTQPTDEPDLAHFESDLTQIFLQCRDVMNVYRHCQML